MKWHIITDSSSDLNDFYLLQNNIRFSTVPFAFNIGEKTVIDEAGLDTDKLLTEISKTDKKVTTACPSPQDWCEQMSEEGNYILITISGALSGSFNSANLAKTIINEKYPERKIEVINSCSTGPQIVLLVEYICSIINQQTIFDDVVKGAKIFLNESKISFALSSFDNLVNAGRMPNVVGKIAMLLGIWGVGYATEEGTIEIKKKIRGEKGAIKTLIEDIKERIKKPSYVIISHCHNLKFAEKLKTKIKGPWDNIQVKIMKTRGLCSYYAERGGVIVGFCSKKI
ncbi:MAG: DegV family EDD domain-containing protein [Clostridia bacterium]|nr:DegV family EDD domain-containing protein [Clostridia bacterium]